MLRQTTIGQPLSASLAVNLTRITLGESVQLTLKSNVPATAHWTFTLPGELPEVSLTVSPTVYNWEPKRAGAYVVTAKVATDETYPNGPSVSVHVQVDPVQAEEGLPLATVATAATGGFTLGLALLLLLIFLK